MAGEEHLIAIGAYYEWLYVLEKVRPRSVVVANDYLSIPRALLFAARTLGIASHYIPHAMIGRRYYAPPMPIADNTYVNSVEEVTRIRKRADALALHCSNIHVTPRYAREENSSGISGLIACRAIGVSVNDTDDFDTVASVVAMASTSYPWAHQIWLRPHPASHKTWDDLLQIASIPAKMHRGGLFDYFRSISLHIAGATMMHLDSSRYGIPSMIIGEVVNTEHYGFVDLGVAIPLRQVLAIDELQELIRSTHASSAGVFHSAEQVSEATKQILEMIFAPMGCREPGAPA